MFGLWQRGGKKKLFNTHLALFILAASASAVCSEEIIFQLPPEGRSPTCRLEEVTGFAETVDLLFFRNDVGLVSIEGNLPTQKCITVQPFTQIQTDIGPGVDGHSTVFFVAYEEGFFWTFENIRGQYWITVEAKR